MKKFSEVGRSALPSPFTRRTLLAWLGCGLLSVGYTGFPGEVEAAAEPLLARFPWMTAWVEKDGFDPVWLERLMGSITPSKRVIELMDHQAEAKPYHEYRELFINDQVISTGKGMLRQHRTLLNQIERRFGAPAPVLVTLWGIESRFGRYTGKFPVLETLFTLATAYPRRAPFFQNELREFLLLCREEGWDPTRLTGSYAGAIGQMQMIPSTMRRFAVDFDGDGRRDIFSKPADVLASIASFLQGSGWRKGGLLAVRLAVKEVPPEWITPSAPTLATMRPWRTWAEMGLQLPRDIPTPDGDDKMAVIMLEGGAEPLYYVVFNNFWVITQWNRSNRFAMVVQELSEHLRQEM